MRQQDAYPTNAGLQIKLCATPSPPFQGQLFTPIIHRLKSKPNNQCTARHHRPSVERHSLGGTTITCNDSIRYSFCILAQFGARFLFPSCRCQSFTVLNISRECSYARFLTACLLLDYGDVPHVINTVDNC